MDFSTTEAAHDLGGLVGTIVDAVCTPAHQRELDGLDQRFDRALWQKLIDADILSAAAPESIGGGGYGVLEQTAILVALGRQLAAVPYLESVMLAAGALGRFGSPELQQRWAAPAVSGEKILTVALDGEPGDGPVQATWSDDQYRLHGSRTQVPFGPVADAFLVPAETDSGTGCSSSYLPTFAGVSVTAVADHRSGQRRTSSTRRCRDRRPADSRHRTMWSAGFARWPRWAAALFSSVCSTGGCS